MALNRRQLIVNSAGLGACLAVGSNRIASAFDTSASVLSKPIPSTGELLPVMGLGTNRWVAAGSKSEMDDLRDTLVTFQSLGGRVIDTAPSYRSSEKALGWLIDDLNFKDAFFLATKVDRDNKAAGIARMRDSLDKLGKTSVDLMQIHSLRGAETQLDLLAEWKDQGIIRYIGITTSRNEQFAEMEALMKSYSLDFIQLNYSLLDRNADTRLLPLAQDKGIAVMVNRPLAHGHLFKAVAGAELPGWATEIDCESWAQFFLKYVVSHPAVTCTIPGTTNQQHVLDNMGAGFGRQPDQAMRRKQEKLITAL